MLAPVFVQLLGATLMAFGSAQAMPMTASASGPTEAQREDIQLTSGSLLPSPPTPEALRLLQRERRQAPAATAANNNKSNKKTKAFEQECLAAHNKWRRLHGANDLVFDKKITAFSQKRADYIAASDGAEFRHPNDLPYGENLAWHSRPTTSCSDLIKMWYDEVDLYDFRRAEFDHETGHFTQLVWRNTERVGCARAYSGGPKGGIYLVCNYDPPGNFLGEALENVLVRRRPLVPQQQPTAAAVTTSTIRSTTALVNVTPAPPQVIITSPRSLITSTTSATTTTTTAAAIGNSTSTSKPSTVRDKNEDGKRKKKGKKKNKNKNKKNKNKKNKNKNKNKKKSNNNNNNKPPTTTTPIPISNVNSNNNNLINAATNTSNQAGNTSG